MDTITYNSMYIIIGMLILLSMLGIGALCMIALFIQKFNSHANRYIDLLDLNYQYNSNYSTYAINQELDSYILDVFDKYVYIHKYDSDTPPSDRDELQMYEDILLMVLDRMSPTLINKASLIYSKNMIHEVIRDRVIIIVSSYCMELKKPKNDNK